MTSPPATPIRPSSRFFGRGRLPGAPRRTLVESRSTSGFCHRTELSLERVEIRVHHGGKRPDAQFPPRSVTPEVLWGRVGGPSRAVRCSAPTVAAAPRPRQGPCVNTSKSQDRRGEDGLRPCTKSLSSAARSRPHVVETRTVWHNISRWVSKTQTHTTLRAPLIGYARWPKFFSAGRLVWFPCVCPSLFFLSPRNSRIRNACTALSAAWRPHRRGPHSVPPSLSVPARFERPCRAAAPRSSWNGAGPHSARGDSDPRSGVTSGTRRTPDETRVQGVAAL